MTREINDNGQKRKQKLYFCLIGNFECSQLFLACQFHFHLLCISIAYDRYSEKSDISITRIHNQNCTVLILNPGHARKCYLISLSLSSLSKLEGSSSVTSSVSWSVESVPWPRGRQLQQQVPIPALASPLPCFRSNSCSCSDWSTCSSCLDREWLSLDNVCHPTALNVFILCRLFGYILQVKTRPDGKLPFYSAAQIPTVPAVSIYPLFSSALFSPML